MGGRKDTLQGPARDGGLHWLPGCMLGEIKGGRWEWGGADVQIAHGGILLEHVEHLVQNSCEHIVCCRMLDIVIHVLEQVG